MPEPKSLQETVLQDYPRLGPDDTFTFRCGRDLDCFTHCCRDVSIVLTPYDVLRLKRALRMDSSEFLREHTISPFQKDQKIPAVLLKMRTPGLRCGFVTEQGCGVYESRPWACRMYPLGTARPRNATPHDRAFYFLLREEICHGHGQGGSRTVGDWLRQEGIEEYEANGASFQALMLHEFWDSGKTLTPAQMDMFHMACYDLDRFRRFVFETRFLQLFDVDEARVEALRSDDEELLEFGIQWLRFSLFKEKTMKFRREVLEARRKAAR